MKDNRAISSIKGLVELCAVQLLWGKEWEGPLWYFVVAIKLSLIAADTISINWNLPWPAVVTQPMKTPIPNTHTPKPTHAHSGSLTQTKILQAPSDTAIFRHGRKPVILTPWHMSLHILICSCICPNLNIYSIIWKCLFWHKMLRYICDLNRSKIRFLVHNVF